MAGPPNWSSGDRPRWRVAPIDPERPAEITAPIPVAQCSVCAVDGLHVWSEVDAERTGTVVLVRSMCVCDQRGRCDAQATQVIVDPG